MLTNYPQTTALAECHKLFVVLSFSSHSKYFLITLFISSFTHELSTSGLFSYLILGAFPDIFLLLTYNFIPWFSDNIHIFVGLASFWIHWDLFYGLEHGLSWQMPPVDLKRMSILRFLGGIFYKCKSGQFDWWWCSLLYPCQFYAYLIH